MAQDEQPPGGLLSKVVKFVRNPTANWAELGQAEDKDSRYSKQMLKEMIERKRANDFVRRREFDQLRKLRLRGPATGLPGADAADPVSFFNTSQPSKDDDRAGTLKKIDEIEAQMSQQWWKARGAKPPQPGANGAQDHQPGGPGAPGMQPEPVAPFARPAGGAAADAEPHFATTIDASLPLASDDAFPPSSRADAVLLEDLPAFNRTEPPPIEVSLEADWQSTPAFVETAPAYTHDARLEEAAIRFANGDDAGAEAALLALLDPATQPPATEETWMTLFDLYRAVGPQDRFDALAAQFATRFARPAPAWFSIAPAALAVASAAIAADNMVQWASPAVLGAAQVQALQSLLVQRRPQALGLDWSALTGIEPDAREPLAALMVALAQQVITIHGRAGGQFESQLRRCTVSGDRSVHQGWWRLRLDWLRVSHQAMAFDLAAMDYCVTFEVSPPSWFEARCRFVDLGALPDPAAAPAAPAAPQGDAAVTTSALSGVLTEDATEALAPFERQGAGDALVVVSCEHLVRADFAATGSLLTWASAQQSAGRRVQFRELHRLVAIFFHVVGVGEYAAIQSRRH
jgi:hypothetical protein